MTNRIDELAAIAGLPYANISCHDCPEKHVCDKADGAPLCQAALSELVATAKALEGALTLACERISCASARMPCREQGCARDLRPEDCDQRRYDHFLAAAHEAAEKETP